MKVITQQTDLPAFTLTRSELAQIVTDALADFVPPEPEPEVLDQRGCAELLGVSTKTIRALVRDAQLPEHRCGDSPRYLRTEILAWLQAQRGGG